MNAPRVVLCIGLGFLVFGPWSLVLGLLPSTAVEQTWFFGQKGRQSLKMGILLVLKDARVEAEVEAASAGF